MFIKENLTDFFKTVETGVDPRLSLNSDSISKEENPSIVRHWLPMRGVFEEDH